MSLIAKEITALLTASIESSQPELLHEAFERLKLVAEDDLVVGPTHHYAAVPASDLWVYMAETALAFPNEAANIARYSADRIAECCVGDDVFGASSTTGVAIRGLYVRAAVARDEAVGLRGYELVVQVHNALALIVRGIQKALGDLAQLSYLVHTGTEHLWNGARLLYHDGTYGDIVAVLGFACTALEKIDYHDVRCRAIWLFRYATALAGCGRGAEALTVATKGSDLVAKSAPQLKYLTHRMQVGLQRVAQNPKAKADAKGVLRGIYATHSFLCGAADAATVEADIMASIAELGAEIKLASEKDQGGDAAELAAAAASSKPGAKKGAAAGGAAAGGKGAAGKNEGATSASAAELDSAVRDETFAELGFAAALIGQLTAANDVAQRTANMKRLIPRVYSDYTKAVVQATQAGGIALQDQTDFNFCRPETAHELLTAIRRVDRSLESAMRIPDPVDRGFVVQQGAILIWNLSLPLLQPSTRALVAKSLQTAVKALDDIDSNLLQLRAQLHLEVATTDADAAFVGKASARVTTALGLDYQAPDGHVRLYGLNKPLDRYLVWLKRCLDARGQSYTKPENAEDEALSIIEQAADANNPSSRAALVLRAVAILEASEPAADYYVEAAAGGANGTADAKAGAAASASGKAAPAAAKAGTAVAAGGKGKDGGDGELPPASPEVEQRRQLIRTRTMLWSKLLALGWGDVKSPSAVTQCRVFAQRVLARTWYRRGDRDMRTLQANAAMTLAEMLVVELKKMGLTIGQKNFLQADSAAQATTAGAADAADANAAGADDALVEQAAAKFRHLVNAQAELQAHLKTAATIGAALVSQEWPDEYLVCNAATALWNFFCPAFAEGDFYAALEGLEAIYPLLVEGPLALNAEKEAALMGDVGLAYARALVQSYMMEKAALADGVQGRLQLQSLDPGTFNTFDANSAKLNRAAEVCEKMIAVLPTPMDAMRFLGLAVVIKRLQAKPAADAAATRTDPQQRVIAAIEQCRLNISLDEKRALLASIPPVLAQDPNMELCARLAERCLSVPGCERLAIRVCTTGQTLYSEGKLGLRRTGPPTSVAGGGTTSAGAAAGGKGAPAAAKQAPLSKGGAAADADATPPSPPPPPQPTDDDWTWYALLLQYQSLAVASLVDQSVQDKTTQNEIRKQCLTALTNSAIAATRAVPERRAGLIMKATRLFAHIAADFATHPSTRTLALPSLKLLLSPNVVNHIAPLLAAKKLSSRNSSSHTPAGNDGESSSSSSSNLTNADAVMRLFLLLTCAHRDQSNVDAGLSAMKVALKLLPASHHKPFWDLDVELRCQAGLPLNQTLLRVKEYDVETQARVWMGLARHSNDRKNQLFGYQNAIQVLEPKPIEKAAHLVALAQWMLATNYDCTVEQVRTVLLSAVDLVSDKIDVAMGTVTFESASGNTAAGAEADAASGGGSDAEVLSSNGGGGASAAPGNRSRATQHSGGSNATSRQGGSRMNQADADAASRKPGVKELVIAIEAYYILARIAPPAAASNSGLNSAPAIIDGGVGLDARTCLLAAAHYVSKLWDTCAGAASAYLLKRRLQDQLADAREKKLAALNTTASQGGGGAKGGADAAGAGRAARSKSMSTRGGQGLMSEDTIADAAAAAAAAASGSAEGLTADDITALALPVDAAGWLAFHPSALLITTLRSMDSSSPQVPSAQTLPAPQAFTAVLRLLADELQVLGAPLASLPALAMAGLVTQVMMAPGPITAALVHVTHADAYRACLASNAAQAAAAHRVLNPTAAAADQAALLEEARVAAARLAARTSFQRHNDPNARFFEDEAAGGAASNGALALAAARDAAPSFGVQLVSSAVLLKDPSDRIHALWVRLAACLLQEGRAGMAAKLLDDVAKHAPKYGDVHAESECYALQARLLALQGHPTKALEAVKHAYALLGGVASVEAVCQLKLLEATLLFELNEFDTAFALEREVQQALGRAIATRVGLHKALAEEHIPHAQLRFAVAFVRAGIAAFKNRVDERRRPPKAIVERLSAAASAAVDRALMIASRRSAAGADPTAVGGRGDALGASTRSRPITTANRGTTAAAPGAAAAAATTTDETAANDQEAVLPAEVLMLLAELDRLQLDNNNNSGSNLVARKRLVHRTACRLRHSVADLRARVEGTNAPGGTTDLVLRQDDDRRLGRAYLKLAVNTLDAVQLRREAIAVYKSGNQTAVPFPRVAGASMDTEQTPKLEARIVDFMRSTRKQRDAAVKRDRLAAERAEVEAARAAARAEKQRQIEERREQRRQDESLNAPAAGAKGAKDLGKSQKGKAGAAATTTEEPDVDPKDKCDIPSPPCSEDDGDGEDSDTESDEELCYAIKTTLGGNATQQPQSPQGPVMQRTSTLPDSLRLVAHASVADAADYAQRALDLFGTDFSVEAVAARTALARAQRLLADEAARGLEERRALLEGHAVPPCVEPFFDSHGVHSRWTGPVDPSSLGGDDGDSAAAAAAGAKGPGGRGPAAAAPASAASPGAKGGKAPAGGKGGAAGVAGTPDAAAPSANAESGRVSGVQRTTLAPVPPVARQALLHAQAAVAAAIRIGDVRGLADAAFEVSQACVVAGYPTTAAAQWLSVCHAAQVHDFVAALWTAAAAPAAPEAALLRAASALLAGDAADHGAFEALGATSVPPAGSARTPVAALTVKQLYTQSKMLQRLRVPDAVLQALLPPDLSADCFGPAAIAAAAPLPPLPADATVLTLLARDDGSTLYAVIQRGGPNNKEPEARRTALVEGAFAQLTAATARYAAMKRATLASAAAQGEPVLSPEDNLAVEFEFASICRALGAMLQPLLSDLQPLLSDGTASKSHLYLCLDPALQPFPFEALPAFLRFKSISRDLSVYTIQTRAARRAAEKFSSQALVAVLDPLAEVTPTGGAKGFAAALFGGEERPKQSQWTLLTATPAEGGNGARPVPAAAMQRALLQPANAASIVVSAVGGALPSTLPVATFAAAELAHLRVLAVLDQSVTAAAVRRENQANMAKSSLTRFAEQPWCVALLAIARGVDCVLAVSAATPPVATEAYLRLVASNLDKPQVRSFAELARLQLQRSVPTIADNTDAVIDIRAPSVAGQAPPASSSAAAAAAAESDPLRCWSLPASDRLSFVVYGVSPDDGTPAAAAGGGGGKAK